jgi:hypothetical protein
MKLQTHVSAPLPALPAAFQVEVCLLMVYSNANYIRNRTHEMGDHSACDQAHTNVTNTMLHFKNAGGVQRCGSNQEPHAGEEAVAAAA